MVRHAKALASQQGFTLPSQTVIQVLEQQGFTLSAEQQEAVFNVCSPAALAILQGSAGAGKTTSLSVVRQAYQQHGFQVRGVATAKLAADNLASEAGIPTQTIARLLTEIERGRPVLDSTTVLLIDEAGQLGSSQLATLLEHASQRQAKVVLTGEDKQLDAISHGGALRYLSRPEVLGTSRIETIRRQRQHWARQAVMQLRDGQALAALQAHQQQGLVHFARDSEAARTQLIERYKQFRQDNPDKQAVVLAQRWEEVEQLSTHLRRLYQAQGKLEQQNITLPCHVADRMMRVAFSIGERVRLTRNDYRRGFSNGTLGTITHLEQGEDGEVRFHVRSDDGRALTFTNQDYCNEQDHLYLTQAYAFTVYASQGITVDGDVFVLHNPAMDRAMSYVAGSRHKDQCHWFFNHSSIAHSSNRGEALTQDEALTAVSTLMSEDRYQSLAIEHLAAQEAQTEHIRDNDPVLDWGD